MRLHPEHLCRLVRMGREVMGACILSIRCILGDIRLWVGDTSTSSCRVFLPFQPTNPESITSVFLPPAGGGRLTESRFS